MQGSSDCKNQPSPMIKLVAFDWNGTILSDTIACLKGDDAALIALGYKPISLKKFRDCFEIPLLNFYKNIGVDPNIPKDKYEKSEAEFHRVYEAYAAKSRTRAGVRDLLKFLKNHNIPCVIFSNHLPPSINRHLQRLKIANYFETVLANSHESEILYKREKGERLQSYLKTKGVNPKEVLIVGDTAEEIEIARQLGGISVALTHGYYTTSRLKAAKPDYLFGDLRQIEGIIIKLQSQS